MLFLTISTLCALALVNYRLGNKTILYPGVVLCSLWAADLILVGIAGDFFYPLSPETLFIFLCGCLAFSLGSWLALLWPQRNSAKIHPLPKSSNWILSFLVLLIVAAVPLCYRWITSFASGYGSNLLLAARTALLDEENAADKGSIIFGNLVSLSIIVGMIAFYENGHGKKRSFIAIGSALALNLLTGGRAWIVGLLFPLICLDWMRNRRVRWKLLVVLFLIFVISFSVVAIYLGKAGARADAPLSENIVPVAQGFVLYAAGGLVAFDRVIREPNIIPHSWQINRFFLQTMNRLGARFEVPSLHAEFVSVGPNSMLFNVYTFYFAYLDWGYLGMMGILATLGFIITVFYRNAVGGSTIASLVYSTLFGGLITSIFNEGLLFNLNFLLKLSALYWLIYVGPVLWTRFNQFTSRAVAGDIASRAHPENGVLGR